MDEDISSQPKKVHFLDLFGRQNHDPTNITGFYNQFRNLVIANLKKKGDIIMWQNNEILLEDEKLSPTFEELILAVVLGLIDPNLPVLVRSNYCHLMGKSTSLMDYRTDILAKVPTFLVRIEDNLPPKRDEDPLSR